MSAELARDIIAAAFGLGGLSIEIWLLITVGMLVSAAVVLAAMPSWTDAIASEVTLDPARTVRWVLLATAGWAITFTTFVVTIIGIPLAMLVALAVPMVTLGGYVGISQAIAARLVGRWDSLLAGIGWTLLVLLVLRALRLVPLVGGVLQGVIVWLALAAGTMVTWDLVRSWHARRMPDAEQFPEGVIEWNPPEPDDRD